MNNPNIPTAMEYISHMEEEEQKVIIDFIQEKDNEIEELKLEVEKYKRQFKLAQKDAILIKDTFKEKILQQVKEEVTKEVIKGLKDEKKTYNKNLKKKREKKIHYEYVKYISGEQLHGFIMNNYYDEEGYNLGPKVIRDSFPKNMGISDKEIKPCFHKNIRAFTYRRGAATAGDESYEIRIKYNESACGGYIEVGEMMNETKDIWKFRKQNVSFTIADQENHSDFYELIKDNPSKCQCFDGW